MIEQINADISMNVYIEGFFRVKIEDGKIQITHLPNNHSNQEESICLTVSQFRSIESVVNSAVKLSEEMKKNGE